MATATERLPINVAGPYFVDATCIDCDLCRASAPELFGRDDDSSMSFVRKQPETAEEIALVEQAMSDCATNSIGREDS